MAKESISDMLLDELERDPAKFLERLNGMLAGARLMVWAIIQKKQFSGFEDAEKLVKAYDHLDKAGDIFKSYQLPLPLKENQAEKPRDKRQTTLVQV